MPTFGELKTIVSRKLQDPTNTAVSSSDVGQAINDALRYWKFQRFWFNEAADTTVLPNGQRDITSLLPDDFLYEFPENGFVIPYAQISYAINKVSPQIFDSISIRDAKGIPYIYTFRNQSYFIYFAPQQDYDLNIYYIRDYDSFVDNSDTNAFSENADQLLIYEALGRLTGEDRQDLEMNNTYFAKADRESKNLKQRTFKQTGSGSLTVYTILE